MPVTSNAVQSGLATQVTTPSKFTKIALTTPLHFYAFDKKKKKRSRRRRRRRRKWWSRLW
jgi:hypothetical protein